MPSWLPILLLSAIHFFIALFKTFSYLQLRTARVAHDLINESLNIPSFEAQITCLSRVQ